MKSNISYLKHYHIIEDASNVYFKIREKGRPPRQDFQICLKQELKLLQEARIQKSPHSAVNSIMAYIIKILK